MTSVLIADQDDISVKGLEIALQCIPDIAIAGRARTGDEALAMIRETRPDVVVVDVQLPIRNGYEVVERIRSSEAPPEIVFIARSEIKVARAFELEAVDYLVRPFGFPRIREAIRRAQERIKSRTADARFAQLQRLLSQEVLGDAPGDDIPYKNEVWVKGREGLTRLPTADIDMIEAAGDYVMAHVGDQAFLLNETLAALEEKLSPNELLRIHRSCIVNRRLIRTVRRRSTRGFTIVLTNGQQKPIGPKFTEAVLDALGAKRWRLPTAA